MAQLCRHRLQIKRQLQVGPNRRFPLRSREARILRQRPHVLGALGRAQVGDGWIHRLIGGFVVEHPHRAGEFVAIDAVDFPPHRHANEVEFKFHLGALDHPTFGALLGLDFRDLGQPLPGRLQLHHQRQHRRVAIALAGGPFQFAD